MNPGFTGPARLTNKIFLTQPNGHDGVFTNMSALAMEFFCYTIAVGILQASRRRDCR